MAVEHHGYREQSADSSPSRPSLRLISSNPPRVEDPSNLSKEAELIDRIVFLSRQLGSARTALHTIAAEVSAMQAEITAREINAESMMREVEVKDGKVVHRTEELAFCDWTTTRVSRVQKVIEDAL